MFRRVLICVMLIVVLLTGGCTYVTEKISPLIPSKSDLSSISSGLFDKLVENTEGTEYVDNSGISSFSDENIYDYSTISPVNLGTSFALQNGYSDIKGVLNYTVECGDVFKNLYQAGFEIEQVGYPQESAFPYPGSPKFKDIFDAETGDFVDGIGILCVSIGIENVDAYNMSAEVNFGDGYLFDIRKLYLVDFQLLNYFPDNFLRCAYPVAFSGLNFEQEGAYWYRLRAGDETSYKLGYIVNLDSFEKESLYLCEYSGFQVPDEVENIMFIGINKG